MTDKRVQDLMTTPVLTAGTEEQATKVVGAMAQEGIRSTVVTTDGCTVEGVFTSTDYMHLAADGSDPETATVGECMTTGVVAVSPTDTAATAATKMVENDISHLPVVDDDEQITGILTSTDLTSCLAESS